VQRAIWVDFAKVLAAFCVILIHVVAPEILREDFESSNWQIANILDSFSRFAPPLFFMISGAMLLGKVESATDFYRKRLSKILIPFAFWALFFSIYKKLHVPSMTTMQLFSDFIYGNAYFHLWFVNAILLLYLLTPLIRLAIARVQDKHVLLAVMLLFLASSYGILFVGQYLFFFKSLGHLAYFICGYLLVKNNFSKNISLFLLGISASITAYLTYQACMDSGELQLIFYEYTSPNVIAMSIFIYLLVKRFELADERKKLGVVEVSSLTLGVYLIHPLFLNLVELSWLYEFSFVAWVLFQTAIVFLFSYIAVKVLSKIKYLERIV